MRGEMAKGGLVSVDDPANERKRSSAQRPPAEDDSLSAALQRGLANIKAAKNSSESEGDDDDDDDSYDSWSDEDC